MAGQRDAILPWGGVVTMSGLIIGVAYGLHAGGTQGALAGLVSGLVLGYVIERLADYVSMPARKRSIVFGSAHDAALQKGESPQASFIPALMRDALVPVEQAASLDGSISYELIEAAKDETRLSRAEKLTVKRCDMIRKYHAALPDTPVHKALHYSCEALAIGAALYPGPNMDGSVSNTAARYLEEALTRHGLDARVFIKPDHEGPPRLIFFLRGRACSCAVQYPPPTLDAFIETLVRDAFSPESWDKTPPRYNERRHGGGG